MSNVGVLILAAGGSRRLGRSKLLLRLPNGKRLFRHVIDIVAETHLHPVVVVMGEDKISLLSEIQDKMGIRAVYNPDWQMGMSTSLKLGISELKAHCKACLVVLADQPFQTADLITELVKTYRDTGAEVVYPTVNGKRSNPVLFDQATFDDFLSLEGDIGARQIINRFSAQEVPWNDEKLLLDVDTEKDFQLIRSLMEPDQSE